MGRPGRAVGRRRPAPVRTKRSRAHVVRDGADRGAPGRHEVARRLGTCDQDGIEPFGFRDGVSQPFVEGLSKTGPPENTVKAGEFLLGYENEYGLYTDRPLLDPSADPDGVLPRDAAGSGRADLGRNGSYLVFRQLRQDVPRFWHFVDTATRTADGRSDPAARVRLAAKMVGRWPSGAPLTLAPDADDPRWRTRTTSPTTSTTGEGRAARSALTFAARILATRSIRGPAPQPRSRSTGATASFDAVASTDRRCRSRRRWPGTTPPTADSTSSA